MVFAYDFDLESGDISNKRLLVDRRNSYGEPDGMVVEYVLLSQKSRATADENNSTDGNLWIAMYSTWRVMAFNPDGKQIAEIVRALNLHYHKPRSLTDILQIFPTYNMTCTTWGGPNFDTLYITSAKDRSSDPKPGDKGGHVYAFKLPNIKGQPKHEFAG